MELNPPFKDRVHKAGTRERKIRDSDSIGQNEQDSDCKNPQLSLELQNWSMDD